MRYQFGGTKDVIVQYGRLRMFSEIFQEIGWRFRALLPLFSAYPRYVVVLISSVYTEYSVCNGVFDIYVDNIIIN